jgi:hypothetical protein
MPNLKSQAPPPRCEQRVEVRRKSQSQGRHQMTAAVNVVYRSADCKKSMAFCKLKSYPHVHATVQQHGGRKIFLEGVA